MDTGKGRVYQEFPCGVVLVEEVWVEENRSVEDAIALLIRRHSTITCACKMVKSRRQNIMNKYGLKRG